MDADRPSPDALLAETHREGRGRLKIFLGAAPGVGKTYEMLSVARRRRAEGVDVVVGIVETHGRTETMGLLEGLPALARHRVHYRGRDFDELDLDALLARKPKLALVDELAHTNVPGSRHEKRYQDVEELLNAGIDVFTTLNVQHIESLNDLVERITGVKVRERLPDRVLEKADEIELIDLPPEELTKRLREGKVYVPEEAQRAVDNFFSRGNLLVLRELAMRMAVERVDADLQSYMRARAIEGPWPARGRILVCIGADAQAERLVRLGKRIADRRQLPWTVLHVQTSRAEELPESQRDRLQATFTLAEQLGARAESINGNSIASEVLAYAAAQNVTEIVVGRSRRRLAHLRVRPALASALVERGDDFEITIASQAEESSRPETAAAPQAASRVRLWPYVESLLAVALATGVAWLLDQYLGIGDLSLVYLFAVLVTAIRHGLYPGLFASAVASLAFNFFFTDPRFTLQVTSPDNLLSLLFFLLVSIIGGNLAARLRAQMQLTRESAEQTGLLFDFSRRIAGAVSAEDLLRATCQYLTETLDFESIALRAYRDAGLGDPIGTLEPPPALIEIDRGAAEWAIAHSEPAGSGTGTLPASWWLFAPLGTAQRPLAVIGLNLGAKRASLTPEQRRLFFSMRDQAATALERILLTEDVKRAQLMSESDRLRSALLSSVSHDLRTPLASIIGSATGLKELGDNASQGARRELTTTILEEAQRLNRFVQNLLDMTRLGYGALTPRGDWCELRELVGRARSRLEQPLREHALEVTIATDAEIVYADPALLEQVVVNVLDNAAKFSPPGSRVEVSASVLADDIVIAVTDEGPGIPPAERERVFDMFYRVRDRDQRRPGTGLGLAICKGFVEAMGGTIMVRGGRDGHGTRIEIALPRREPPGNRLTEAA